LFGIYYETAEKSYLEAPSPEWAIQFLLTVQTETFPATFSFNSTHFLLLFIPFSIRRHYQPEIGTVILWRAFS